MSRILATAAIATALLAAPAAAQTTGTLNIFDPPNQATDARSRLVLRDYARCVERQRSRAVRDVLAIDYRTARYDRTLRSIAVNEPACAGFGRLRSGRLLLAGELAEAVYLKDYGTAAVAEKMGAAGARGPLAARDEGEYAALCTVRSAPAASRALLDTAVASAEERAAIDALLPNVASCVQGGARATFNRPAVRALIALALYRTAVHAQPAASPQAGN